MDAGLIPDEHEGLKAALIAAIAEAAVAKAKASEDQALIVHLKLEIEKLKRTIYGPRSERTARLLLDQMELRLEELEAQPRKTRSPPNRRSPRQLKSPPSRVSALRASLP